MDGIDNTSVLACNTTDEKPIDQNGETHLTSLTKSSQNPFLFSIQPTWFNSSHENETFLNIRSSSTNGANFKGKEVVIDDENDNIGGLFFCYPKGEIKILDGSNKNADFENEPFVNIGRGATNGANYKGKQVAVDDDNGKLGFVSCYPKGGIKIRDGSNENADFENESFVNIGSSSANEATYKGIQVVADNENDNMGNVLCNRADTKEIIIPPEVMVLFRDFVQEFSEALLKERVQQEFPIQEFAEALYGKEFFSSEEPRVVGPFTEMMAQCHHLLKALQETPHSPPLFPPQTNTITTTSYDHRMFQPPPPTPDTTTPDSHRSTIPSDQKRKRSSKRTTR